MNLRRYGYVAGILAVFGILLLSAAPLQAHKTGICVSEQRTALRFSTRLREALRASVFGGDGIRYISRDLDLNGIGDVLEYMDKRFLPLVEKTNQMWAKHLVCILDAHMEEANRKIEKTIRRDSRTQDCKPLLRAWTLCVRDEPIN